MRRGATGWPWAEPSACRKMSAPSCSLDEKLAAMDGAVMSSAQRQEVRRLVAAAFGAGLDMVDVDERRVGAARGATAALVAREHGATQRRRDALFGARERPIIGAHVGVVRPLILNSRGRGELVVAGVGGAGATLYGAHMGVVWPLGDQD